MLVNEIILIFCKIVQVSYFVHFIQLCTYNYHIQIILYNLFQLFWFLKSSLPQVQDACLLLLKLCAKIPENVKLLLGYNILEYLLNFLKSPESSPFIKSALLLLEVVCILCRV